MRIETFADEAAWTSAALAAFMAAASEARRGGRVFELVLAGGRTPEPAYRALAATRLRSVPVRLWLGDERAVPVDDPARNGFLVSRCFALAAWEPGPDIRPWPAGGALESATRHAIELASALGGKPAFDLAFLGIGDDGHTAGLFPGDGGSARGLDPAATDLAFATRAPSEPRERMSLGAACLAGTRVLRFLTRGSAKGALLARLAGEGGRSFPARILAELAEARGADVAVLHLGTG